MVEEGRQVLAAARAWVAGIDPAALSDDRASEVLDIAVALEALGAGLTLLVAARAVAGTDWEAQGHRSAAGWLAEATRSSVPTALSTLRAAEQLSELPATADAVRAGRLSALEARVVSAAASAAPDAEAELLQAAAELPVGEFTRVPVRWRRRGACATALRRLRSTVGGSSAFGPARTGSSGSPAPSPQRTAPLSTPPCAPDPSMWPTRPWRPV
jgi:hypothetical protein